MKNTFTNINASLLFPNKMSENGQKIEDSKAPSGVHLNANNVPSEPIRTQIEHLNLINDQNPAFPEVTLRKEPISLQRQKCELKRLSRHIHPDLKTVDNVIDGELMKETASECEENVSVSKYEGGVQILRWIFENWTLLEKTGDMQEVRKWLEEKALCDMDVRCSSHVANLAEPSGTECFPTAASSEGSDIKGDTRKTTELFEMQSLDFHKKLPFDRSKLMMAESVSCGDVKGTCQLFEAKPLDEPGHCTSVKVEHHHDPEQATQETKADVKKTVRLLEMEPCCALKSDDVNVHEIKPACRGGNSSSTVKKTRWLFETQHLDILNKDEVQVIPGISLAETQRGNVERKELQTSNDTFNSPQENRCLCIEEMDVGSLNRKSINVTLDKQDIAVEDSHSLLWFLETHPTETSADSYEVNHLETVNIPEDKTGTVLEIKHIFETCALDSINKEMVVGVTKIEPCEIEKSAVRSHKQHFEALSLNSVSQFSKEHTEIKDVASGAVRNNMAFFENIPLFAIRDRSGNFHEVTSISKGQAVEINGTVQNYKWMFETIPLDKFKHREQQEEVICITSEDDYNDNVKTADLPPVASDNVNAKPFEANISRSMSETDGAKTCRWQFQTHVLENTGSELRLTMDNISQNEMDMVHNHSTEASESITREIAMQRSTLPNNNNVKAQDMFESKLIVKKKIRISNDSRTHSRGEHFENDLENGKIHMINDKNKGRVNTSIISDIKGGICNTEFTSEALSLENTCDKDKYPEHQSARAESPRDATDVTSSFGQPDSHDSATCSEKSQKFDEVIREETMSRYMGGSQLMSEPKPLKNSKSQGDINVENKEVQEESDVTSSIWLDTSSGNYRTNKQQKMVTNIEKNNLQMKNQPLEWQQISCEGNSGMMNRGVDQRDVRSSLSLFKNQPFDSLKGAAQNQTSEKTVCSEYSLNMDAKYFSLLSGTQVSDTTDVDMTNRRIQDEKMNSDVKELHWIFESVAADGIFFRNWAESDVMMESLRDTVRHLYHFNAIHSPGIVLEDSDHGGVKIAKYLINNEGPHIQKAGAAEGGIQDIVQHLLHMERLGSRIALLKQDEHGCIQVTNLELRSQQIPSIQTWDNELKTIYYYIIDGFLSQAKALTKGILMQEQEQKHVGMTVYLLNICKKKMESEESIVKKETPSVTNPSGVSQGHRPLVFTPEEKATAMQTEKADPECLTNFHPSSEVDCECKEPIEREREAWEQTAEDPSHSDAKNLRNLPFSVVFSHHSSVENDNFSFDKPGLAQRSDQAILANREKVVPSNADPQSLDPRAEPSVSITKNVIFAGALCDLGDVSKSSCSSKETSQHIEPKVKEKVMPDNKIFTNQRARCQNTSTDVVISRKLSSSSITTEEPSPSEQIEGNSAADVHEENRKGEMDNWGNAEEKELDRQNSELAAAMRSLLLATAEAKSIQREVQAKLKHVKLRQMNQQNETAELESDEEHEIMQLGQKVTSKDKEESACVATVRQPLEYPTKEQTGPEHQSSHSSEKDQETNEVFQPGQKCELPVVDTTEDHSILAVQNSLPKSGQEVQDSKERTEAEVDLRGDVREAITSLQTAAGQQQQQAEKEIIRGGLQAALQSLEKSNMNVSRGDYKAAMIYRRGRLSYREGKCNIIFDNADKEAQSVHTGLLPSATTMKEQSTTKVVNVLLAADDRTEETTKDPLHISVSKTNPRSPTPLPPKVCQKPSTQKPALPPKPEGLSRVPAHVARRTLVRKQ
ncbi:xin actin-binding repeat-containing protein 1-like [Paramormyrops kingsleyae]|uniref:xin actin-binding repeat-containing protein 1-like n=1 Tax=Paramormyrops kingsleyae TaxID=1676925 RepID=UPI003B979923